MIDINYSQAYQDMFVLSVLNGKKNGKFVEVGAFHPSYLSNTYLLEKNFGWDGISIDINDIPSFKDMRLCDFVCADALTIDYKKLFNDSNLPTQIDYLQLDIEPNFNTLQCLKRMPLDDYRFSVITYETDVFVPSPTIEASQKNRQDAREILLDYGYEMIAGNICNISTLDPFEDWYVDPKIVSRDIINKMKHLNEYNNTSESFMLNL